MGLSRQQRRFDIYSPHGNMADIESIGLVPNDKEYELGTPNLERVENVLIVASSSTLAESLLLRLKWRPNGDGRTVTVFSKLTLTLDESIYEFSQVESYAPEFSRSRPGRITQYGSSASKLKLFVLKPTRHSRLFFAGHMKRMDCNNQAVFVRINCMLSPVSLVFDFFDQYDENCLKQLHANAKLSRNLNQTLNELVLHDRHERQVKLSGEYLLVDTDKERRQAILSLRGFYCRHFRTSDKETRIETTRLYALVNNGQGFQIGTRKLNNEEINFGYTSFGLQRQVRFIDKPFALSAPLDAGLRDFEGQVSGQQCTFDCAGERRRGDWFGVQMNGKAGWAWLSAGDELAESALEAGAAERERAECALAVRLGEMCEPAPAAERAGEPLVVAMAAESCADAGLVGSKAASLALLHKFAAAKREAAFRVPFALVLTKFTHELILAENPQLGEAVAALQTFVGRNAGVDQRLRDRCAELEELAGGVALPRAAADELWRGLEAHFGASGEELAGASFAVRSSSWGEDEEGMSAAGQLRTVLGVRADRAELARAAVACFASRFSLENVEYRRQHGLPLDLPMAVVVQRMVDCDRAGVLFTCEPTTGDESALLVTANFGLGESVVGAQADPDSIRVRVALAEADYSLVGAGEAGPAGPKRGLEIEQVSVGRKEVVVAGGDHLDRSKCCLSDEEVLRLAQCGLEVRRFFRSLRRDIEWGFHAGQLYLFQSRPVTGLEAMSTEELIHECDNPPAAEVNFYSRANLGEVAPSAFTHFSLTTFTNTYNVIFYRTLYQLSPDDSGTLYAPEFALELTNEKFHSFFDLRTSSWLNFGSEKSLLEKAMEVGLFGREMGVRPDIVESIRGLSRAPNHFTGSKFQLLCLPLIIMPYRILQKNLTAALKFRDDTRNLKFVNSNDKLLGLYNQLLTLIGQMHKCLFHHLIATLQSSSSNVHLTTILSKYIKDPKRLCSATNKFLALSTDVVSAEIPERISSIAKLILAKGSDDAESFTRMEAAKALEYLQTCESANDQVRKAFDEFMTLFGHRSYGEFEFQSKPWREEPVAVAEMIQRNCSASLANRNLKLDSNASQEKRVGDVIKSLGIDLSVRDKLLIKHAFAPMCQRMLSCRERTKNIMILFLDIVRECTRMLAAELQHNLRIPDQDLFYYLTLEEVKPLVLDHQPALVMQAVRRRQMFKKMFSVLWKFDEIFTELVPNHMKPQRELDEAVAGAPRLSGTPASSGRVQGRVCLVDGYKDLERVRAGCILLTHSTDIAFSPVFPIISGIITEVGGLISHGAVVAREYGLPSVIGIPDVTRILRDGEEIILDADNGTIVRLGEDQRA